MYGQSCMARPYGLECMHQLTSDRSAGFAHNLGSQHIFSGHLPDLRKLCGLYKRFGDSVVSRCLEHNAQQPTDLNQETMLEVLRP